MTSEILVGIHGRAGTGKDVAARFLNTKFGLMPLAFADPIKKVLVFLYGSTYGLTIDHFTGAKKEQVIDGLGRSPRQLMQSLGTEWGRERVNPDAWIMIAREMIKARRDMMQSADVHFPGAVVSDVRFENEAAWIRDNGGLVIHLRRAAATPVNEHVSESGIAVNTKDVVIGNNGSIEQLHKQLYSMVLDAAAKKRGGLEVVR